MENSPLMSGSRSTPSSYQSASTAPIHTLGFARSRSGSHAGCCSHEHTHEHIDMKQMQKDKNLHVQMSLHTLEAHVDQTCPTMG